MKVEVSEEPISTLDEYASIPISFEVRLVLDVTQPGNNQDKVILTERRLVVPYVKDYDGIDGENPAQWPKRFNLANWGLFAARVKGRRVGGAAVAFKTPELTMLEGREDLAVVWDIRVSPEARGQGVGSALFRAAEAWARAKGCRQLKVETQNINAAACRFYAKQGCVLAAARNYVYKEFPDEAQLLWYKELCDGASSG